MLSPDAKAIWKSKAGGGLMAALLGSKPIDDTDRETVALLVGLAEGDDQGEDDGSRSDLASDEAIILGRRRACDGMAFDRATVRRVDQDGRLHVEITNISKATVNPYMGREIPGCDELGLQPDRVYQLLRSPEELAAGAPTFNNIPLLREHVPVSAENHRPDLVVGSTGTDAVFEAPYLKNSLVVWSAKAIEGIENGEARELSCAYRYTPVMEPGVYDGARFDGRMTDLVGNHVALVAAGRAGADVVVGDSQLKEAHMQPKPLSRKATLAKGALLGLKSPFLAADAKLNLNALLEGVTAANWLQKKPGIIKAIRPKLAADADIGDLVGLLDAIDDDGDQAGAPPAPGSPAPAKVGTDDMADAIDADPTEEILSMLRGKLSDQDLAAVQAKLQAALSPAPAAADPGAPPAADEPPPEPGVIKPPPGEPDMPPEGSGGNPFDPKNASGGAMDAASVKRLVNAATDAARRQAREAAEAREIVKPWVGTVAVALDSGEAVYKAALEILQVKTDGIHPSAFRPILEAQPKPGSGYSRRLATDAAPAGLADRFPGLSTIKSI